MERRINFDFIDIEYNVFRKPNFININEELTYNNSAKSGIEETMFSNTWTQLFLALGKSVEK